MQTPITQLNRVELIGTVGSAKVSEHDGKKFARICVATNCAYRDREGNPVIETQWSECAVWENGTIRQEDICALAKGTKVHLVGRMRTMRYTGVDGIDRPSMHIVVSELELIESEQVLEMQML